MSQDDHYSNTRNKRRDVGYSRSVHQSNQRYSKNNANSTGTWNITPSKTTMSDFGLKKTTRNFDVLPPALATGSLDALSFVSRQLSSLDDQSAPSLRDYAVQEEYLQLILSKQEKMKKTASDMSHIVLSIRKLREGIVSSNRLDSFSVRVYELSANLCLEAKNTAELFKTLVYLVHTLYPALCVDKYPVLVDGTKGYTKQDDTHLTRAEMSGFLLLLLICEIPKELKPNVGARNVPQQSSKQKCHGDSFEILRLLSSLPEKITQSAPVVFAMQVYTALSKNIDFYSLSKLWDAATHTQRMLMSNARPVFQHRTLHILSNAYFGFPEELLISYLCLHDHSETIQSTQDIRELLTTKLSTILPGRTNTTIVNGIVPLRSRK
ncbi:hypothetical protein BASA82_001182 [Batrachochytrium salamandrivorans]|uniref:Uncharacterized protein n=1 Tax=Batrachochytrium salamandrivorans TaxID=1357716 RepID=A0ABQ8F775_9FUNG|nr:hypothetical protein BASA62_006160 [Batrachochytrium salamandrivorans]KAH6593412.1 hypothetical protein BASA50_007363 [Batrachochytrium salamandrivorans]KAH9259867.1 hypothetical protein BASA82_001182 [Batrachochytrium salamandrivorans]